MPIVTPLRTSTVSAAAASKKWADMPFPPVAAKSYTASSVTLPGATRPISLSTTATAEAGKPFIVTPPSSPFFNDPQFVGAKVVVKYRVDGAAVWKRASALKVQGQLLDSAKINVPASAKNNLEYKFEVTKRTGGAAVTTPAFSAEVLPKDSRYVKFEYDAKPGVNWPEKILNEAGLPSQIRAEKTLRIAFDRRRITSQLTGFSGPQHLNLDASVTFVRANGSRQRVQLPLVADDSPTFEAAVKVPKDTTGVNFSFSGKNGIGSSAIDEGLGSEQGYSMTVVP